MSLLSFTCQLLTWCIFLQSLVSSKSRLIITSSEEAPATDSVLSTNAITVEVPIDDLRVGDSVLVLPGETIPIDVCYLTFTFHYLIFLVFNQCLNATVFMFLFWYTFRILTVFGFILLVSYWGLYFSFILLFTKTRSVEFVLTFSISSFFLLSNQNKIKVEGGNMSENSGFYH